MSKSDLKGHNNSINESEVDNKVVTVGSNQGHRALTVAVVIVLLSIVYYFYLRPSNKISQELIDKKEIKKDIHALKDKLEKVPDEVPAYERIIVNPLPPLPEIVVPQSIPEVKTEVKKEEVKEEIKKQKDEPKKIEEEIKPKSNIPPLLNKKSFVHDSIAPMSTLMGTRYPPERRKNSMSAFSSSNTDSGTNKVTNSYLSDTPVVQSRATKMGKFDLMIGQGKIIDAILETAINSDMTGVIRAVVSRDIYAEKGNIVLVPRGSKLIGMCSFDSNIARSRVNIGWTRIILPNGIDVVISSPGTDELGVHGVTGIVDNKIIHRLFSSIIITGMSIGAAVAAQKASVFTSLLTALQMVKSMTVNEIDFSSLSDILDIPLESKIELKLKSSSVKRLQSAANEVILLKIFREEVAKYIKKALKKPLSDTWQQENVQKITLEDIKDVLRAGGSRSVYEDIVQNSIGDLTKDMKEIINTNTDAKPTVYVNQGTALKVFVNQDIIFPVQAIVLYK